MSCITLSSFSYLTAPVPVPEPGQMTFARKPNCSTALPSWSPWVVGAKDPLPLHDHAPFIQSLVQKKYDRITIPLERPQSWSSLNNIYVEPCIRVLEGQLLLSGLPRLQAITREADIGTIVTCVLGNRGLSQLAPSGFPNNIYMPNSTYKEIDWTQQKKCLAVAYFVNPGTVCWNSIQEADKNDIRLDCGGTTEQALFELKKLCRDSSCAFGLITDGIQAAVFDDRLSSEDDEDNLLRLEFVKPKCPIRFALASLMYAEAYASRLCRFIPHSDNNVLRRGAPGDESILLATLNYDWTNYKQFSEFDLYTMQRQKAYLDIFTQWHVRVRRDASTQPVLTGHPLRMEVHALYHSGMTLWRSPFPNHRPPEETLRIIRADLECRPRFDDIDKALRSHTSLQFITSREVRTGTDHYSQVFFGRLAGTKRSLCLKLFDERLFPVLTSESFLFHDPKLRLNDLHCAEDMIRREENAYEDRLKYLQGSLIPHCYGFHEFALSGGWNAYGMLLEVIDGVSLHETRPAELSVQAQKDLVRRFRHAVRAIRFAGVMQEDWRPSQIICRPTSSTDESKFNYDMTFIDFAFATQRLGEHMGTPINYDMDRAEAMLALDLDISAEVIKSAWDNLTEEEY